jgi:NAD(P)-dependent dehydrogenase (short-subunit alcohol dehydrogenase family)
MATLDGRVAIVTGAGRGIGRAHAQLLAAEGAAVVVNDVGVSLHGDPSGETPAEVVAQEIQAAGGTAVADTGSVSSWADGERLIEHAVDAFGRLDVLVNNAGIIRDTTIAAMTEADWDAVVDVNLKGHFVPTHFAASYWRSESKAGHDVCASIVHTSSGAGFRGNPGQANYASAKAAVATFSLIAAQELARYGVRSNCIAPTARTRLTKATPWLNDTMGRKEPNGFDPWDPANMSPIVAFLAMGDCPFTGTTFSLRGGSIRIMGPWTPSQAGVKRHHGAWQVAELAEALTPFAAERTLAAEPARS